jgi:putative membrane protein
MKNKMKKYLILILKGMGMGAADVIPGVSGGTIAFITGIYEELINSIKSINPGTFRVLFNEGVPSFWKAINGNFLLSIVIGIGISVLSLARLLKYILENYPELIWSFFFGLIVASAIYVAKQIRIWNIWTIISLVAGIVAAYIITEITPAETTNAWWFVFLSGAIAICAMILPGISGSFILLLMGKYTYIIGAVSDFQFGILIIFLSGAVVGIISFSNLLSWLLKKYHHQTIAVLAGFMIGSLNKVWPWKNTIETFIDRHGMVKPLIQQNVLPGNYSEDPYVFMAIVLAITGFVLIFVVERFANDKTT